MDENQASEQPSVNPATHVVAVETAIVQNEGQGEIEKKVSKKKMKNGARSRAKETWEVADRTTRSAALRSLQLQVKEARTPGQCAVRNCKGRTTGRNQWCPPHKKEIRQEQLRLNNIVWKRRVKAGTARHHVVYGGSPTSWATQHRDEALKLVKRGRSIVTRREFLEALKRAKAKAASKAARRRG